MLLVLLYGCETLLLTDEGNFRVKYYRRITGIYNIGVVENKNGNGQWSDVASELIGQLLILTSETFKKFFKIFQSIYFYFIFIFIFI